MRTVHRAVSGTVRSLIRLRERSGFVDHTWRAIQRYDRQDGSRLAAATAYYGFFATFALAVLLFAILGATLARVTPAQTTAEDYLRQNLPLRDVHALVDASRGVSVLAIGALVLAGIWWIESMRASQRAMWHLDQHPGNIVVRYLVDLAVLVGLGLLLVVSLGISLGLQDVLLRLAGGEALVLAAALLAGVPRLHIPPRRLLPSALLIVVWLTLLKTGGRWYVDRMTRNPAYQLAAGAIGLLVFMYLFNQVILFASAFAATSTRGRVRDLAAGPPAPFRPPTAGAEVATPAPADRGDPSP